MLYALENSKNSLMEFTIFVRLWCHNPLLKYAEIQDIRFEQ